MYLIGDDLGTSLRIKKISYLNPVKDKKIIQKFIISTTKITQKINNIIFKDDYLPVSP